MLLLSLPPTLPQGDVFSIITASNFPSLDVLFLRGNVITGMITANLPPKLQVLDLDNNEFSGIEPGICKAPVLPAFQNKGGCSSDWPNQPLGTCCMKNNNFAGSLLQNRCGNHSTAYDCINVPCGIPCAEQVRWSWVPKAAAGRLAAKGGQGGRGGGQPSPQRSAQAAG